MSYYNSQQTTMRPCCVSECGQKPPGGVKMFLFPKPCHQTESVRELSKQRQEAWVSALGISDSDQNSLEKLEICSSHFISGKMASLQDVDNLDWVPTMNLQKRSNRSDRLRCSISACTVSNLGSQCNFYRIPKINKHGEPEEFSEQKLTGWLSALGIRNEVPATHDSVYVCTAHYIIEKSGESRETAKIASSGFIDLEEVVVSDFESTENNTVPAASSSDSGILRRSPLVMSRNQSTSISSEEDSPFFSKSGEILRCSNGKFSFLCNICDAVTDDCLDMLHHISRHYDKNEDSERSISPTSPLPEPEFVSCTITDDSKMEPEPISTFRELTNTPKPTPVAVVALPMTSVKPQTPRPPQRRLLPKISIEDLAATRPFKIKKISTVDAPAAAQTFKLPMRIPAIPPFPIRSVAKANQSKPPSPSAAWSFGKNYEIIYKNKNSDVALTSSKDLRKGSDAYDPEILKCSQCKFDPPGSESAPRNHECRECKEWFGNHLDYRSHYLEKHRYLSTERCYQCEMEPPTTDDSDPRRHKCAICKEWFPNHAEFNTHLKDEHDENVTDFSTLANDYKEFTCYICEKNLKQREYLIFHMKGHFEKYLEYQCHQCGLRVRSESALKEHLKRHDNNPTECDVCNKVFPNYTRMRTHRNCHTQELKYVCEICSKGFKLSKYLNRHMAVHNEVKICCRYCDASFKFATGRRAHEKSQHNVL